jgi:hypothetical protein
MPLLDSPNITTIIITTRPSFAISFRGPTISIITIIITTATIVDAVPHRDSRGARSHLARLLPLSKETLRGEKWHWGRSAYAADHGGLAPQEREKHARRLRSTSALAA